MFFPLRFALSQSVLWCWLVSCLASKKAEADPSVGPFLYYSDMGGAPYTVTYDERSFILNGQRTMLLGGSIHYPRLAVSQWPDILKKARDDGLNHVEIYVFWNLHEPSYDFSGNHVYNWEGRADLLGFLDECIKADLFVNLRIGPYVCAEWDFGGLPVWLLHVDGISFRDDNEPWKDAMGTWVQKVAEYTEPYLAKNGGPIILAQIENEYHGSESYIDWCGQLALGLDLQIPWVMCNGLSANGTVNTCNGNNCFPYAQTHGAKFPGQPLGWTENEGWYQFWGLGYDPDATEWDNRSPSDMAYSVAIWIAAGGSHHNYYMWYGGNHLSHWAGNAVANWYGDGVNYHADGLVHEPKRSHLMRLHKIIADIQETLFSNPVMVGNEIEVNPVGANTSTSLFVQTCDISDDPNQQWAYDEDTMLLSVTLDGKQMCPYATGSADPVLLEECDATKTSQQWKYTSSQFVSVYSGKCLDIEGASGPNVDEYTCKEPNSANAVNQEWLFNGDLITSVENIMWCLTASDSIGTWAYQYATSDPQEEIVFLVNSLGQDYTLPWNGWEYDVPALSVSILDWQGTEMYNTAKVDDSGLPTQRVFETLFDSSSLSFSSWSEETPLYDNPQNRPDNPARSSTPLEQIRWSNESSEYFYYETSFSLSSAVEDPGLHFTGRQACAYLLFLDGLYVGEAHNYEHTMGPLLYVVSFRDMDTLATGEHSITVLSSSLGISNNINNQEGSDSQDKKGITGSVNLVSGSNSVMDLESNGWYNWIGSTGEALGVGTNPTVVRWTTPADTTRGATWYKSTFSIDDVTSLQNQGVVLLDIGEGTGMRRGHFWLNGEDMGHYNSVRHVATMVQQYYYLPFDLLLDGTNTLIFQEELPNCDTSKVSILLSHMVVPSE